MKRILIIIGAIVLVIAAGLFTWFFLTYTELLSPKDVDRKTVYTYTNDDGLVYTERQWDWKPMNNKEEIHYTEDIFTPVRTVQLNLVDEVYYDINIPDVPIIYDFGKTIYAEDGSFEIRVVGNVTLDNLSAMAGIDKGTALNQLTIVNSEKSKGKRIIATVVDDCGIIANIFNNDEYYSIIRDSLGKNHKSYLIDEIPYSDTCNYLSELVYTGSFVPQLIYRDITLESTKHLFEYGYLWTQSIVEPFYRAKQLWLTKMVVTSGMPVDSIYETDDILFASAGDVYIGVVNYNTNTSIVLIGEGEEAYCNIVSIIDLAK